MIATPRQSEKIEVDILVCTFRRPLVRKTLLSIDAQVISPDVSIRIIVADNDDTPSASSVVDLAAGQMNTPVVYLHAPSRNISIARNACLDRADADWIVFLDDDERASPNWLAGLMETVERDQTDAAFGPVKAQYGDNAPGWIREYDHLSTWPQTRGGEVQTGYTGNAILRWRGADYINERFKIEKGKTGGEDTEFFFRLWRAGARFSVAEDALVYEDIEASRLSFDWIQKRKYRTGQSYGRHSGTSSQMSRLRRAGASVAKIAFCSAMSGVQAFSVSKRRYWRLRGAFHAGVLSSVFGARERASYGE